ncbi:MAG: ABC transporter ATP-binding protein [Candidatus Riflebacteria bacterium]|nr:ABC transporter ATP-binding protein [Candidatus Riflebacteria bacterium]
MIEIDKLTKCYGQTCALSELTLSIPAGEVCGLLGPNGAGKTTTIRVLNGLVRPTSGRVTIGGFDIETDPRSAKRMVGYVPDRPYLFEKLTGHEFLAFVGGLYDLTPAQTEARAREMLELYDLTGHASRLIEGYSHGMKQKLIITASLLHRPRIFIVDEPMVGLDPRSARKTCDMLRALGRQGVTVLLSTHTLSVAEMVCDRIAILNRGKLVALGKLDELKARSRTSLEEVFLKLTEEQTEDELGLEADSAGSSGSAS